MSCFGNLHRIGSVLQWWLYVAGALLNNVVWRNTGTFRGEKTTLPKFRQNYVHVLVFPVSGLNSTALFRVHFEANLIFAKVNNLTNLAT